MATTLTRDWQQPPSLSEAGDLSFAGTVQIGPETYFHAAASVRRLGLPAVLHVLYPERAYREAWHAAMRPPLIIGGLTLLAVALLAAAIAARVTQPLDRLRVQVEQISQGRREPVALPPRQDEVRDLTISINHLTERLIEFEEQTRKTEQLRTLAQIGGGLAHQLRNAATGARMALDLHRRQCSVADPESLDVATLQLEMMERYLRRFLRLGSPQQTPWETVDLVQVVGELLPLVQPAAHHAGVQLKADLPSEALPQWADRDGMEHVILNLLLNAIEAAAVPNASEAAAHVRLTLEGDGNRLRLLVENSGAGPSPAVRSRMFEPFVSDKPDGAGLGLSVARQVVEAHGGAITWRHDEARHCTQFVVELPATEREGSGVQTVGG